MDANQNKATTETSCPDSRKKTLGSTHRKRLDFKSFSVTFFIMACFWILFSGKLDGFHISLGLGSCLIVSAISSRLLFPKGIQGSLMKTWLNFVGYLPWLFYQIFIANIHVLCLTFHPKMIERINPKIIKFKSRLKTDVSRTTFANSITLTPGTITIYTGVLGTFAVHCLDDKSRESLPGEMEEKIAKVFDE